VVDPTIQPAAHEDAKVDARAAAKWLIAAFAAVGAVLISGVGLSSISDLSDGDLALAALAAAAALASVIAAVTLVADVLTPSPTTLKDLAKRESKRNEERDKWKTEGKGEGGRDPLVEYLEGDPSFLQGIAGDAPVDQSLVAACAGYEDALAERYDAAEACWDLERNGEVPKCTDGHTPHPAQARLDVAIARIGLMHETIRRLERIAAAQQTVQKLRGLRTKLIALAVVVAVGIGLFAYTGGSTASRDDLRGPVLEKVNLSGANLRAANFGGLMIRRSNFRGTDLEGAELKGSTWVGTICPDGTDSDKVGHTCAGHLKSSGEKNPPPLP
jgi:Pentapeptide repeats (8 copies)